MTRWDILPEHCKVVSEISTKAKIQEWKPKKLKADPIYKEQVLILDIIKKISTNQIYSGIHWAKRKEIKDLYKDYCRFNIKLEKVVSYPARLVYEFNFKRNPLDTLNCAYMAKMIEDCLVEFGIIENDDPAHIFCSSIYSNKAEKDYVRIIITEGV